MAQLGEDGDGTETRSQIREEERRVLQVTLRRQLEFGPNRPSDRACVFL